MKEINKPAGWLNRPFDDLLECEAGRAYIGQQFGADAETDHKFWSDDERSDSSHYEIYSDGSMWFVNNAEDEVWADFRDFITDSLIPGIAACPGVCWDADEYAESDDPEAWKLDAMDRNLLLHYCDGDGDAAKAMIGIS